MIRVFVFISVFFLGHSVSMAQDMSLKKDKPVNQLDGSGKKHGDWVIKKQEVRGEPEYTSFGAYVHGVKNGTWYKMDDQGDLVSIENYANDFLSGVVKYYSKGQLACVGNYLALNTSSPYDSVLIEDPVTGAQSFVRIPSSWGTVRHGMWHYYEPLTGRLIRDVEYQVDNIIYTKEYPYTKEDTVYYQKRAKNLPHKKQDKYKPPAEKQHSYIY